MGIPGFHDAGHPPFAGAVRPNLGRVRWRRLAERVLLAVAIPFLAYLLVANLLLRTRLLRNAVSGPSARFAVSGSEASALRLDYESAYSIVPGRVHVEGLGIRGRDRVVEWQLTLDHADVAISLHDLLRRTFHATRLRSSGLTMRARLRLDRVDAIGDVVGALPPIAGFSDPPLRDIGPESPPLTDATYKLWTVDLEDVDVEHVREVWIHTLRSEGDTHVRGRWLFHPQRWLDVGPATVEANGVDISYGGRPLATGLSGSFDATVHPFDLRLVKRLAIFDHVSYDGQLRGRAFVAEVLRLIAPRSGVTFTRGEGSLDARMILDHGRIDEGTRVRVEAPNSAIETGGLVFEAPISAELSAASDVAHLDTRVTSLRVSRFGVERARIASVVTTVSSGHLQLSHVFDDARFALDVRGAETNDLGAWTDQLPPSTATVIIRSGTVTVDGHADGSLVEERGRGELRLVARRLKVTHGFEQFSADVTSDAQLREVSLKEGTVVGAATITADQVSVRLARALLAGRIATHVEIRQGMWRERTFDLSGSDLVLHDVTGRSDRGDAVTIVVPSLTVHAPRLALAPSGVDGHVSIDLPRADLANLDGLRALVPLPPDVVFVDGTGRAKLHADVDLGSGAVRGDGAIVARGVRARVGATQVFADLDCSVRARRTGGAGSTDLSGTTVAVTRAGTGSTAPPENAWWANGSLREATLRTTGGWRFNAKAHLTAKDASPATALVAENSGVPAWAANLFQMPGLDVDAEVRVAARLLDVRSLIAHGGGSRSVRAEYVKRDGMQDGAVLMDLGWIDLAYDLTEGAPALVILGPRRWYAHKTATLRDVTAAAAREANAAEQLARFAAMTPELRTEEARALAAQCRLEMRTCDGTSIKNLLQTAVDAGERDGLSGIVYAPMAVAAAVAGTDGTTIDPRVEGSVAEALKMGGPSTLDNIPSLAHIPASGDSDARGKLIAVTGRVSSIRSEGSYSSGTLTTDAEPVTFVTPFGIPAVAVTPARFRGVFVQRYEPQGQPTSIVLVGAFDR